MLASSSSIILNADEIWKFSRTALSLYKIAVSDLVVCRLKTGGGQRKQELLLFFSNSFWDASYLSLSVASRSNSNKWSFPPPLARALSPLCIRTFLALSCHVPHNMHQLPGRMRRGLWGRHGLSGDQIMDAVIRKEVGRRRTHLPTIIIREPGLGSKCEHHHYK